VVYFCSALDTVELSNLGDTVRLSAGVGETKAGWTRVGVHLHDAGTPPPVVDRDWHRASLERDVAPRESATLHLDLPPIGSPGRYLMRFDLVIEGVMWLADRGTRPAELLLTAT
jgi:hypothetical protein